VGEFGMTYQDDPALDDDLAAWNEPGWLRLDLDEKTLEVLIHFALRPESTMAARLADLWPGAHPIAATTNLQRACERINDAASTVTGKAGALVEIPGRRYDPTQPKPKIRVHTLVGMPAVDVR